MTSLYVLMSVADQNQSLKRASLGRRWYRGFGRWLLHSATMKCFVKNATHYLGRRSNYLNQLDLDSGIGSEPGTVLHFFIHTCIYIYTYCCFWCIFSYFSRFSAIQNKTFLRIGASPRLGQHKELLVHEEEDSRHLGERIKFEGISGQNPATNVPTYAHPWEPPLKKEVGIL